MTKEFIHIAFENVQLIKNAPNESLHKNEFRVTNAINIDELIDFLVENDFIETEKDNAIYFLTPETYDLIDKKKLRNALRAKTASDEIDFEEEQISEKEVVINPTKQNKINLLGIFVVVLIIAWLSFIKNKKSKPSFQLEEKTIEIIKHKSDSILKIYNQEKVKKKQDSL